MSSYYQKNREKLIENQLRYYRNNRERCLEYFRAYNRAYYLRHRAPKAEKPPVVQKPARMKEKPVPVAKIAKERPPKKVKPATIPKEKAPKIPSRSLMKQEKIIPPKAPAKENTLPEYELKPYDMQMDRGMFVLSFS
jgi:hypothetical protein